MDKPPPIEPDELEKPVWKIAAEDGTETAAVRELMLENWPSMTQSQARKRVREHKKLTGQSGLDGQELPQPGDGFSG